MSEQPKNHAPETDGICFAFLNGEQFGPFACEADALAALDRMLLEAGELVPGMDAGSVIFADPAIYHMPPHGTSNA